MHTSIPTIFAFLALLSYQIHHPLCHRLGAPGAHGGSVPLRNVHAFLSCVSLLFFSAFYFYLFLLLSSSLRALCFALGTVLTSELREMPGSVKNPESY